MHLFTASGVVCTLFAFLASTNQSVGAFFFWLGLALFIDAADGPLARLVDTKAHLPRFSGEHLDLIIDYLNYVALPAFFIVSLPIIDGSSGVLAAALILLTSLFHFSDTSSKTSDGYFIGFPAIWNIVVFYLFVFKFGETIDLIVILALCLLTFLPIRWVHPFRVKKLRVLTVLVVILASLAAVATVLGEFDPSLIETALLIGAPVYLVAVSLKRSLGEVT
ncbi:MAG: phosphatidylcholine synthase [bacterium]|nr:phosphatidylcholine synthase [bacterium]